MFLYYKVLHKKVIDEVDNYYSIENPKNEYLAEHITTDGKLDTIYEMMQYDWVKDIMHPLTSDCETNCLPINGGHHLIPFDKIRRLVADDKHEYYVTDEFQNNKIVLDTTFESLSQRTSQHHTDYRLNPFYIIDCIYEWERFRLNDLSEKCLPYHVTASSDRIHLDIIKDIIYPRYLHYKTIRH